MNLKEKRGKFQNIDKLTADQTTAQTLGLQKPAGAIIMSNRIQKIIEADPKKNKISKKKNPYLNLDF